MSREAFELWWGDALDEDHYECSLSWSAWSARDAEVAALKARVDGLLFEMEKMHVWAGCSDGNCNAGGDDCPHNRDDKSRNSRIDEWKRKIFGEALRDE